MESLVESWVVCVVVLTNKSPREYENFYVGVKGSKEEARAVQTRIAKVGFKSGETRFFPDQIESLVLKEKQENKTDEQ